jgi:outer membrane protein assembly factor BamB
MIGVLMGGVLALGASKVCAQDWPQWRGPDRDNKVTGFIAPKSWPKALSQKWKTKVGTGESSPVLVGDKIFVIGRQGGDEVIRCLDATNGNEVWQDKYATQPATGPAAKHAGPRSTPAVAAGKVCTLGVRGVLSCLDASSGKVVWRKDSKSWPKFFTSSSPLIVDGMCVAYLGGEGKGELVAYDLASGEQKWLWPSQGTPYGSPVLMTVAGTKTIVTPTSSVIVGIGLADGKLLWKVPFASGYNDTTGTPNISGSTVYFSGQESGAVAVKIEKEGDKFTATEIWKKSQTTHRYNTPVLREGLLFGMNPKKNFFCMDAKTGDVLWTDSAKRGECGTILNAGAVLMALTSDRELIAIEPSNKEYKELAKYIVADTPTWAYPIIAGNRVFVKDQDSVALWTME